VSIERLTHESDGYFVVSNNNCFEDQDENYCGPVIESLAAYEDTEMSPQEVKDSLEMFKAYRHVCGGKSPEEVKAIIERNSILQKALELSCENPCNWQEPEYWIKQAKEALSDGK
jgi:hypothetical protein